MVSFGIVTDAKACKSSLCRKAAFDFLHQASGCLMRESGILRHAFEAFALRNILGHVSGTGEEMKMAFGFKKEYKELYMPRNKPEIVTAPKANYIAVRGKGNPNEEGGAYQLAVSVLYAVAYTLRMSHKTDHRMEGLHSHVCGFPQRSRTIRC